MNYFSFTRSEKRAIWVLLVFLTAGGAIQFAARQGSSTPGYRLIATAPVPHERSRTKAEVLLESGLSPNTAPAEDLELLPGIGPALALRIVRHREAHGHYLKAADLLAVPGVGDRLVARITPYLRFP